MARRKLDEINAGSMADIAFLLLIFFLVTTTMEVDAGISRNLPLKRDLPVDYIPPPVHDRDVLIIMANSQDQLLVEGEFMEIEDLEEKVRDFYLANQDGRDNDIKMPMWTRIDGTIIAQEMARLKDAIENGPENLVQMNKDDLAKWEKRKIVFEEVGPYSEISNSALIQLKNQSNTSYGLYIEIQNILKKVVNDLKREECNRRGWKNFDDLDPEDDDDAAKLEMLQVLVPERIIEAKIEI